MPYTPNPSRVVALRLANAKPKARPTKFFVLDLDVALRWNDLCGSGSFMYAVPQKGVAHRYWHTDPETGELKNKFILVSKFAANAPAHTFCNPKNGNKFDLRACNIHHYHHSRGGSQTAVELLKEKASRENRTAPRVPFAAALVAADKLDWADWTIKP